MKPTALETVVAFNALREIPEGEMITYERLREVIGMDAQRGLGYCYVMSARKMCLARHEIVFAPVIGKGIKRITPREVIDVGAGDLRSMRRKGRRAIAKQATIADRDLAGLGKDAQHAYLLNMSMFGILTHVMRPTIIRKMEARIETSSAVLTIGDTMKLINGKS